MSAPELAALLGLLSGAVLGVAGRAGRFCTLSAIEDAAFGQSCQRLGMWGLAIATCGAAVAGLALAGVVPFEQTLYLSRAPGWPVSALGGGLFGLGMALTGACGYGALARLGGGDMRFLVVFLVMGVTAYMTMRGLLAPARAWLGAPKMISAEQASAAIALGGAEGWPWVGLSLSAVLAGGVVMARRARPAARYAFWSVAVGLAVAFGFAATGWIAADPFDLIPVETHTFTAPMGQTIEFAMFSTGVSLRFGVGSVAGVVIGAAFGALARREFRWEACDDARELKRLIIGAALMGVGGVLAMGCTVGQGVAAASLWTWSAFVTLAAIYAGAWIGLTWLIRGDVAGPILEAARRLLGRRPE